MDVSAISNNSSDIQSLLLNDLNAANNKNNTDIKKQTAVYAQKGEPMYMADMDSDDDGTVTLDEYREYCKSKGINTREMIKMSQLASSYRTMKAENETIDYISKLIPNVHPNLKQQDSNSVNPNNKFNISNDINNEKMVSYKEYMEYCQQNSIQNSIKSNAKVETDENGILKITNSGKSAELYGKSEENNLMSTFEDIV